MEPQSDKSPLIVIVGETASGKSNLAMYLARQFGGEIIAADSRTIYRGMDIGTAKPSLADRRIIPHHLLDVVTPGTPFTAADFKRLAQSAIKDVRQNGHIPILVGGTGLYIDAVLYNFSFAPKADAVRRDYLQQLSVAELQHKLREAGIGMPLNDKNPRHLIRQLETGGENNVRDLSLRPDTLILGVQVDREILRKRIALRTQAMLAEGLANETQGLAARYGWDIQAMQTIGYREFCPLTNDTWELSEISAKIEKDTLQYAKRQRTWFRRNKSIHWINGKKESVDLITTFLNKYSVVND